jgi:hypothetical protein
MILAEGGILLVYGLFLGVAGALIGTSLIQGLLFGVAPNDPITLVTVAVMMVLVGVAACWLPALRAAKIDPAVAIRRPRARKVRPAVVRSRTVVRCAKKTPTPAIAAAPGDGTRLEGATMSGRTGDDGRDNGDELGENR